jgi:hypothetical protein
VVDWTRVGRAHPAGSLMAREMGAIWYGGQRYPIDRAMISHYRQVIAEKAAGKPGWITLYDQGPNEPEDAVHLYVGPGINVAIHGSDEA